MNQSRIKRIVEASPWYNLKIQLDGVQIFSFHGASNIVSLQNNPSLNATEVAQVLTDAANEVALEGFRFYNDCEYLRCSFHGRVYLLTTIATLILY